MQTCFKPPKKLFVIALVLTLFSACSEDGGAVIVEKVTNVIISDFGNAGDGSDIKIEFELPEEQEGIKEYRVYIVKSEQVTDFDLSDTESVLIGNYWTIPGLTNFNGRPGVFLVPHLKDTDGSLVSEETAYAAFVLSVPEDPERSMAQLSNASNVMTLRNENVVVTLIEQLSSATGGVAVDASGNIYVADIGKVPARGGTKVFKISPLGEVSTFASGGRLRDPSGNTFDSQGNLYQSNLNGHSVIRISPGGQISNVADKGLSFPVGITIDSNANLFVTNCGDNSISKIDPDGNVEEYVRNASFNCPNGIAFDEEGVMYVTNFNDGRVLRITQNKVVSVIATVPGGNNGHITYHNGIFYVAARGDNRLYTMTKTGSLSVLAGNGERASADGPALEASFTIPNDIGFSPDGKSLYFNHSISTDGTTNSPSMIKQLILKRE